MTTRDTERIHLDLIYRDSYAYQQGRNDALRGQPCRTDGEVFAGYYISYVVGYDEASTAVHADN